MIPELASFFKTSFGPPPILCYTCFFFSSFEIRYVWDYVCHKQRGIECVDVSCKALERWPRGAWQTKTRSNETARVQAERGFISALALMWMNACGKCKVSMRKQTDMLAIICGILASKRLGFRAAQWESTAPRTPSRYHVFVHTFIRVHDHGR